MAGYIAGYTSRGIDRLTTLPAFLPEFSRIVAIGPGRPGTLDAVLGWGSKPTARRARRLARRRGLPYVALEDGFLRSLGLGVTGFQPHSLVVDSRGIYYDASRPSDLECLIRDADFSTAELARARHCMALLARHRLSKYNHAPDRPLPVGERPRVLVVDQTHGDASIHHGGADAATFATMLDAALHEHPDAEILVKVHPDVIAGKKRGHLLTHADHPRCRLIAEDLNPWALFDAVDTVHVVTSQLGFEALLAGKRVVCHGLPFFAGWGLTEDRQACPRRGVTRSLEQLFAAAYLRYCRYANPYTGQASTLEATIDLIADQRGQRERLAGHWVACGFSGWKRGFVGDFLGDDARCRHRRGPAAPGQAGPGERLLAWSPGVDDALHAACERAGVALWRMEDGFIRSVGLGVDLTRPLSLVLDRRGIYYDPERPSDLEHLLEHGDFDDDLLERAAALRQRLVRLRLSKYNLAGALSLPAADGRRRLLVPGQVETDASIARGAGEVRTNAALLAAVRRANPDACILYKPHPDVTSGARKGALSPAERALYDHEVGEVDIATLLDEVDEVHTISSLAGFEALLRGRQVTTYGLPFYAGWGLTRDQRHCPRRRRRLSLDALVAGTLIRYPVYVDPRTRQLCNAETAVDLLERERARCRPLGWKTRLYRRYRNAFIGRH
ncbi:capsular polysaccharide biosynthesis protein [Halomonas heilongjiangensis]|uniref:Beta-3-deoxy-D-manno-oct-2-ulosonic acid transferase n=1 Tax=Halomonas heilongjiangensis TaxID=1387883 RepID=A0A2N7TRC2_9GAMM|nr:capsular polysaccharide biosynthesis protein [Halomonas heilongjiangensis]PMR70740.1 beta-3-deoxy-D-manno-oct-2-ulosonic acid transferase [Halomonas heilongjiangensis]PXX93959.1 beta-3-deoxy-D-manno-oct-2-ulosonic acid transferase [Halomonas heilongjiangensis]